MQKGTLFDNERFIINKEVKSRPTVLLGVPNYFYDKEVETVNKSKKLLSLFLALCMALTLSPTVALAAEDSPVDGATTQQEVENDTYGEILPDETDADGEEESADTAEDGIAPQADDDAPTSGTCGENLTWTLDSNTLTISGTGKMTDYTDDNESPWNGNQEISKIIITSGVTSIGNRAFYNCSDLTNITIPNSIASIGDWAFYSCGLQNIFGLRTIQIPDSVTSIGNGAFSFCGTVLDVKIPDSVTSIGEQAFSYCVGLHDIKIPNNISTLADEIFYGCSGLESVTIPSSVTNIGKKAFSMCTDLAEVNIPDSVISIEKAAFDGCSSLGNITIPHRVTSIGEEAFRGCRMSYIRIPNSVTSIGDRAFSACTGLSNIILSDKITRIGDETFSTCTDLASITIPDSVTSIGEKAFDGCSNLKDVSYSGNRTQWQNISIESGNSALIDSTIYFLMSDESESERKSGDSSLQKMSKEEIKALLEANPTHFAGEIYEVEPSCVAPYATGKVTTAALQAATNRLNALRKIAGLPAVTLSEELSENAQYGAVLMAKLGDITHYPDKPDDMDQDFFAQAAEAARTSNLATGFVAGLIQSVDSFMTDNVGNNVDSVGHRMHQLNPELGKVGFGYVSLYTVEKVFDRSGDGCIYDFISWPSSGNFPVGNFFSKSAIWSIAVNPARYIIPDKSQITVTLTRASDNKSWIFSGNNYPTSDQQYFNVDDNEGLIIFRPASNEIEKYEGRYTVKIDGLKRGRYFDFDSTPVTDFTYSVDFFDPTPEEPIESYTVTYNSDGGTGNMNDQTFKQGETFTLPASTFTKAGFTFAGWNDGTNTYQAGDTYTMPARNVTFTAQWNQNTDPTPETSYTVSFNGNGGVLSGSATLTTDENGKLASLPSATRSGYTFNGWYATTEGGEQITTDTVFTANTTVYAQWKQNNVPINPTSTYTISFDTNGGVLSGSATMTTNENGKLTSLPSATRSNYIFNGWYTTKTGGEQITIDTVFNADTTVYAQWSYSGGGGSSSGGGSSGGGGGSSSSSNTTTTTNNPDGSTTTTATNNSTGAVTTTTIDAAGNKTETVTQKDGSSVVTVTRTDGTTATITTSANGQVTAEVKLSAETVNAAQQNNQTAALPIQPVQAVRDTAAAPSVMVNTGSAESIKVEIPVANLTPGTVAVLVRADGTEEIIKRSVLTANGISVTLPDGATVKIKDNTPAFTDITSQHWAMDAVTFSAARELFNGTTATTFSPEAPVTRAMLVTVLARFDGVDTSGGEAWYDKGREWAVSNNVSDGTNLDVSVTREQMVTMFWRYMGSPASSGDLSSFTDADQISDYAKEAMRWAVENGIMHGRDNGVLDCAGQTTRAELATIFMNFIQE